MLSSNKINQFSFPCTMRPRHLGLLPQHPSTSCVSTSSTASASTKQSCSILSIRHPPRLLQLPRFTSSAKLWPVCSTPSRATLDPQTLCNTDNHLLVLACFLTFLLVFDTGHVARVILSVLRWLRPNLVRAKLSTCVSTFMTRS